MTEGEAMRDKECPRVGPGDWALLAMFAAALAMLVGLAAFV